VLPCWLNFRLLGKLTIITYKSLPNESDLLQKIAGRDEMAFATFTMVLHSFVENIYYIKKDHE
jgi:hypothetical protein